MIEAVKGENSELREMGKERKEGYPKWLENLHTIRERIQNNKNMAWKSGRFIQEQKMDEEAFFRMMDLLTGNRKEMTEGTGTVGLLIWQSGRMK